MPEPAYPNLLSRLLVKTLFVNQWIIPPRPPRLASALLSGYERLFCPAKSYQSQRIEKPIFIMSLPRSGSSMLQDVMCTHPQLAYINNIMHIYHDHPMAADTLRKRLNLNATGERFLGDSVNIDGATASDPVGTWAKWLKDDLHVVDGKTMTIGDYTDRDREYVYTEIKKVLACFGHDKRLMTKNPALLPHFRLLQDLFPDGKFIYLIRDPRMNANSMLKLYRLSEQQRQQLNDKQLKKKPFVPYPHLPTLAGHLDRYGVDDVRTTAHLWKDSIHFVEELKDDISSFYEIHYEDILSSPETELGKLFDFCELSMPGSDNAAFQQLFSKIGTVHHKNTYDHFETIEEICGPEMRLKGY